MGERLSIDQWRASSARRKRRNAHPEDDLHRAVVKYWALAYPLSWSMTFHSPQGMAARNRTLAAIFKGLGVKPGVFDLICIHRRGSFNGFALELKAARGVVSPAQREWLTAFERERWLAKVAYSVEAACAIIDAYHYLPDAFEREG